MICCSSCAMHIACEGIFIYVKIFFLIISTLNGLEFGGKFNSIILGSLLE